ncbi:MAG: HEAT repeat domain-containing protein [Actinobacteria bacterium]|nr:HEAT repeat domain-containing protein [Actinomycetota bacterium]
MEQAEERKDEEQAAGGADAEKLKPVVDIFSRLSVACKSRSLYSADHPAARDAVALLHAVMEDSLVHLPRVSVQVVKDNLVFEGQVVGSGSESLRRLASRIRFLNIQEISLAAGASLEEAEALVELLVTDPEEVDAAGGPEAFLMTRGAANVAVVESASARAEEEAPDSAGLLPAVEAEEDTKARETIPEEVEDLLELLLYPEELARKLMGLGDEDGSPLSGAELADAIFNFLEGALAMVSRDFPQLEATCLRSVAESILFLRAEVRNLLLVRNMLPRLSAKSTSSAVLLQFSPQEIADLLSHFFPSVPELTPRAGAILRAAGFRESEVRKALRLLHERLVDLGQVPAELLPSLPGEKGEEGEETRLRLPQLDEMQSILGEYREEELEQIQAISRFDPTAEMAQETTPMLIDLLRRGGSLLNPGKAVELLQQNFWSLAMSGRLDLAAMALQGTSEVLSHGDPALDPYRSDLRRMIEEAAAEKVMQRVIQLACENRGDPRSLEGLKDYMAVLGEKGISAMVEALGAEEDMSVRKFIIDTLTALCRDRVSLLGAHIRDPRWFLVRNLVTVMARLHSQETLPFLRVTLEHPNPKVKYETIRALGLTGGREASDLLVRGLRDPDEKARVLCIRWLGRLRETRAVGELVSMLEDREPGAESPAIKKEIVVSLGEMEAPETFEVLKKYRTRQKLLNRAEWLEVNLAAAEAMERLTAKFPHLRRMA